jgi:hypothetical protein
LKFESKFIAGHYNVTLLFFFLNNEPIFLHNNEHCGNIDTTLFTNIVEQLIAAILVGEVEEGIEGSPLNSDCWSQQSDL